MTLFAIADKAILSFFYQHNEIRYKNNMKPIDSIHNSL